MPEKDTFMAHWIEIDPERMARYETMYEWTEAAEAFYAPAEIRESHAVADFGCGPGHAALEFARRVGPSGHVHALDINAEFIARARARAEAAGLAGRITTHLLTETRLPLTDAALDRVVTRNTLVYVQDPAAAFAEFRRVLKPGGIAHAIESDWSLTVVEPLPSAEWAAIIRAASWAWRTPEMGRRLHGAARRGGFQEIAVRVLTKPDTEGRLLGMIRTVAGYARESGTLDPARIDAALAAVEQGLAEGRYLAVAPQFLVTARA
ncbi:MAG: methyltransferase domain-containing protein [Rhodospirillales bacterium]|nr:methyltransferase domain-containing protein [Rhodospirillales bacterium]